MAKDENGFVYILTNPSFKDNWIKIGCTEKLPQVRSKELSNTAVPFPFHVYGSLETKKYKDAEKLAHNWFSSYRINENREFFLIDPEKAMDLFKSLADFIKEGTIVHYYNEDGTIHHSSTYGTATVATSTSTAAAKKGKPSKKTKSTANSAPDPDFSDKHIFSVEGSERYAKASGYYDEKTGSFTVLKGSVIAMDVTPTFSRENARNEVLKICDKIAKGYCLREDFTFTSHSTAVSVVLGRSENGNKFWKDSDGKKLGEIYPKK